MITPKHILPEWYFLWLYGILKILPNKLIGILAICLILILLFLIPYINININIYMLITFFFTITDIGLNPISKSLISILLIFLFINQI